MRRKQTSPELKLFELDTLKYISLDNVKDYIHYIGIFPERMSTADVTFARKSGLLETLSNRLVLSKVALHFMLEVITYREYAFLILSKQWIKTINIGKEPSIYNESLLACILKEIQVRGRMKKCTFSQVMDDVLISKYAPIVLSNLDSLRYVKGLLVASELVVEEGDDFILNPIATALVDDFINNSERICPPNEETEYESYWNSMKHGVFDIVTSANKSIYSAFYPNLIK